MPFAIQHNEQNCVVTAEKFYKFKPPFGSKEVNEKITEIFKEHDKIYEIKISAKDGITVKFYPERKE